MPADEYLGTRGRLAWSVTRARVESRMPVALRIQSALRHALFGPISRPTKRPASAITPMRNSHRAAPRVREDGARLYPAMPFTSYTFLTRCRWHSRSKRISSVAPVHAPDRGRTPCHFPSTSAGLLGILVMGGQPGPALQANPAQSPEWNRGAYVSEALAHCGECPHARNVVLRAQHRKEVQR